MNPKNAILQAKSRLIVQHPYFGMLASRLKDEPSDKIHTYASNGIRFLYNPEFILLRSRDEIIFILTNCVMHHVLSHQQRQLNRHSSLWQLATDYAINNLLKQNGFKIPEGANYDETYQNMYAEEIYNLLKDPHYSELDDAFDKTNRAENLKEEEKKPFSNLENIADELDAKEESEWEYAASVSKEIVQRKSIMPSGLQRLAKKVQKNDIDWRFELYNAINKHMRNNYAFMPPNKKHLHRGFILPSLSSDTLSLCVAIDTSGSIDENILSAFTQEFKNIMTNFPSVSIELLIADAKVHHHYTFQGGEELGFVLKGGGGTDYRPVFDYIEANLTMSTMLLYFTDGDGWFPKIAPNYEVLWALSRPAKVPFGKPLVIF